MRRGITLIVLLLTITTLINAQGDEWELDHFDTPLSHLPTQSTLLLNLDYYAENSTQYETDYADAQEAVVVSNRNHMNTTVVEVLAKNETLHEVARNISVNLEALDFILPTLREKLAEALIVTTDVDVTLSQLLKLIRVQYSLRVVERYNELIQISAFLHNHWSSCKELELKLYNNIIRLIQHRIALITTCKTALGATNPNCTVNNLLAVSLSPTGILNLFTTPAVVTQINSQLQNVTGFNTTVATLRGETKTCYDNFETAAISNITYLDNFTAASQDEVEDVLLLKYLRTQAVEKVQNFKVLSFNTLYAYISDETNVQKYLVIHEILVKRLVEGVVSIAADVTFNTSAVQLVITHVQNATVVGKEEYLKNVHLAAFKSLAAVQGASVDVESALGEEAVFVITIKRFVNDWSRNALEYVRAHVVENNVTAVVDAKLAELSALINDSTQDFQTLKAEAKTAFDNFVENVTSSSAALATAYAARTAAYANETVNATASTAQEVYAHAVQLYKDRKNHLIADLKSLKMEFEQYVFQAAISYYSALETFYEAAEQFKDTTEDKYHQSANDALVLVAASLAVHQRKKEALSQIETAITYEEENLAEDAAELNSTIESFKQNVSQTVADIKAAWQQKKDFYALKIVTLLQAFVQVTSPSYVFQNLEEATEFFAIRYNIAIFVNGDAQVVKERVRSLLQHIAELVTGVKQITVTYAVTKRNVENDEYVVQVGDGQLPPEQVPDQVPENEITPEMIPPTPVSPKSPVSPKTPTPTPKTPTPTPKAAGTTTTGNSGVVNCVNIAMLLVALLALLF